MKKTLLVTFDFWPNIGGVSSYYYNLAKLFPKDKIVVLSNIVAGENKAFKIIYKKLLYDFFWPKWIKSCIEVFRVVREENVEMIWVGHILPVGLCALLMKLFFSVPYFVSLHGFDIKLASCNKRKKILAKLILKNAKFITVNSETTLELVKKIINPSDVTEKIILLYPGVNRHFADIDKNKKQEIIDRYNLQNKRIILSVGRIVKRKNYELIIDAINLIKESQDIENFRYLIIGSGDNLEYLKQKVKDLNLEGFVLFLDNIDDYELPYFYDISDVFAMISKTTSEDVEGFGIVYLEAGMFKKPVLASKIGGGAEAVQDGKTGILINENSAEDARDAILCLLNDKMLSKKLGENAYIRIVNNFLWKDIYKKLENNL